MINLIRNIAQYIQLPSDAYLDIAAHFEVRRLFKKEELLDYGDVNEHIYFIDKGLLYIAVRGTHDEDHISEFVAENEWIYNDIYNEQVTNSLYTVIAVENCQLYQIRKRDLHLLLSRYPQLHRYFGSVLERKISKFSLNKINASLFKAPSQYVMFMKVYDYLANRVPLQLIASYLNMKPETLSRSRKKLQERALNK